MDGKQLETVVTITTFQCQVTDEPEPIEDDGESPGPNAL